MNRAPPHTLTVFVGAKRLATGSRGEVAVAVARARSKHADEPVFVFDDATGRAVDLDTRGTPEEILRRYPPEMDEEVEARDGAPRRRKRGRPKLGVVGKEVTLLPRHWAWLAGQRGGASATLRRLVDRARRESERADRIRASQDATYRFMSHMVGNEPGYEEAVRALYALDEERFHALAELWPPDLRDHAWRLSAAAFARD